MASALKIVQKFFPSVTRVVDATRSLEIDVTKADSHARGKLDHTECAMAVACRRVEHADGVIISINRAYVIKGRVATRFQVPNAVAREVVSFDRGATFAPGSYKLNAIEKSNRLGERSKRRWKTPKKGGVGPYKSKRHSHVTTGIRTVVRAGSV